MIWGWRGGWGGRGGGGRVRNKLKCQRFFFKKKFYLPPTTIKKGRVQVKRIQTDVFPEVAVL